MKDFVSQYMVDWCQPGYTRLDELALAYLRNTEDHDYLICHVRKGKTAIPVTPEQRSSCSRFAIAEYHRLRDVKQRLNIEGNLWDRIKRLQREFEESYVPPETNPIYINIDRQSHSKDIE